MTHDEYRAALIEVESLMGALPGTPEGERLNDLVAEIIDYELAVYRGEVI